MISSPPPTQQPRHGLESERKNVKATPLRKRLGETRTALIVKSIFRPFFRVFYYGIRWIRTHKIATFLLLLLLVISISLTNFVATGAWPLGIGQDPFDFKVNGSSSGADHIKNWLYAMRDGDATKMSLIEGELAMSQPPDPSQLIQQYSQTQAHLSWKSINVIASYGQDDTTQDVFVSINFEGSGPGGVTKGVMVWHFVTDPSAQGRLLFIGTPDVRALQ